MTAVRPACYKTLINLCGYNNLLSPITTNDPITMMIDCAVSVIMTAVRPACYKTLINMCGYNNLLSPITTNAPITMMIDCAVSVYMTAVRPPGIRKESSLFIT